VLDLDADELDCLFDAFADCPPLRRMVAAFLGIKPKEKPKNNFAELLGMFPGGVIK
jgi:hypothetical protein